MAIVLTETAAGEIKRYMEAQKVEAEAVLRIGVLGGGCSGLQYSLGFETGFDPKVDACYQQHGVALVTTKKMALHLDGTVIDFREGPMGRGFAIENPSDLAAAGVPGAGTIEVAVSDRRQREIHYSGNVQGVGFRYTVRSAAAGLGLTGFVRNLPDGRVHLVVEGPADQIAALLDAVKAEMGYYIRETIETERAATGRFRSFEVRH